jgi:hypothetical protein
MGEQRLESLGGLTGIASRGLLSGGAFTKTGEQPMADPAPLPLDSLHCVLAHLETERKLHEEANDDRRFDAVYEHAGKLREWLSDVDELRGAVAVENADAAKAHMSETPAS